MNIPFMYFRLVPEADKIDDQFPADPVAGNEPKAENVLSCRPGL